jgi:hypothetical protein
MNSKERVKAAIARQPVDRIPLGFYLVDCDTIERVIGHKTYVRNKIAATLALWEGRRDEVVESYKKDTVEFYSKIDCADLITFKEAPVVPPKGYDPGEPPRRTSDDTWEDSDGSIYKISHLSNEIVRVHSPAIYDTESFTEGQFPEYDESGFTPPDPSIFEACDYVAEALGRDRYIAGSSGGVVACTLLGGDVTGWMMYALKPEIVRAANRRYTKQANLNDRYYIRPGQDGVLLEQDIASSKGPMLNPAQFRENCLPFLSERVRNVKGYGQQALFHNCGDNRALMSMFVEAGIDCYQSLQTIAGMEIGALQDECGRSMSFWGGISVETLVSGTPDDVRKNVRQAMERGRRGPGFILGPSHSIAYGTKCDNFMALLDEYTHLADRL